MFKERLISGAILLAGILLVMFCGGIPLWIASLAVAVIGVTELYRCVGIDNRVNIAYAAVLVHYVCVLKGWAVYSLPVCIIVLILMTLYVVRFPKISFRGGIWGILGILYVGVLSSCMYQVRSGRTGLYGALLILISSWGSDTAAYCAGMLFGKRHPFPLLSPKKSLAGCIGGIAGSVIIGIVTALIMHQNVLIAIILCALAGAFSQVGDLAASAIKRQHNIKDYGSIIPGHGGIMDRFDSMLFTGAVIYAGSMIAGIL